MSTARRITPTVPEFLTALLLNAPKSAVAWITSFEVPPDKAENRHWHGRPYARTDTPVDINTSNAYFAIAAFPPGSTRKASEAVGVAVIVCDDIGTKVKAAEVRDAIGEPSYRFETSEGNEQWGYLLAPLATVTQTRTIYEALNQRHLTDRDGGHAVRLARLPVGINNKRQYGKPFNIRCVQWTPNRRSSPADFIRRLEAKKKTASRIVVDFSPIDTDLLSALDAIPNELNRQEWINIGLALKHALKEKGRYAWIEFSKKWPGYDEKNTLEAWNSLKPNGTELSRSGIPPKG